MSFAAKFVARKKSSLQPGVALVLGTLATAAAAGCGDEASAPLDPGIAGSATSGSTTGGSASSGSGNGGSLSAGTSTGTAGTTTTSGSGGTATSTAGTTSAGSGGAAGNGGSAGNGGGAGSGGSGGAACPASAGSAGTGGTAVADPTGDTDSDGTPNCLDACPSDAEKTAPGECGCGTTDSAGDGDGDGTYDCKDGCPADASKVAPGVCGCGLSDTANADNDAAVDCKDACPRDPALTEAGACGCLPASLGATCLAHRYQFEGTGTVVTDSIGASGNGTVVGATLSGTGTLVLAGGTSDQYVKLPSRLISGVGNSATIEAWVTWAGTGGDWQRIVDFGNSTGGQDMQGDGRSYLFLTPSAAGGGLRVAITAGAGGGDEDVVTASASLPTTLTHVAVVIDGAAKTLALYQGGALQGTASAIRPSIMLGTIDDVNNWLGRSQYQADPELAGTYHEVRIYSKALSAAQITASFTAGPDALP
jgi:Concanavalin A-like lectin/glucanases superfamily